MAAEILLIAPDMDLYERAKKLRSTSPISFDVAYAFLESAVELAAHIDQQHPFKVIISRGATLQMLRESDVPAALVDIKMGDFELLHILSDAKKYPAALQSSVFYPRFSNGQSCSPAFWALKSAPISSITAPKHRAGCGKPCTTAIR